MTKYEVEQKQNYLEDLKNTQVLCDMLMKTPHYAKMGPAGIFAVVETAKSLGVDPRQALGGGLYYVKGKVEMSSRMMNALIRSKKHSITRDKKSDNTICILHGKRSDNGDTWTESFSIQEAQQAGLTSNPVWKNFTRDMLFARALSRLARQLFSDIIGNCYVEGEISQDDNIRAPREDISPRAPILSCLSDGTLIKGTQREGHNSENPAKVVSDHCMDLGSVEGDDEDILNESAMKEIYLSELLNLLPDYKEKVETFLEKMSIAEYKDIPNEMYEKIVHQAKRLIEEAEDEAKH